VKSKIVVFLISLNLIYTAGYAHSVRHHLIDMGKSLAKMSTYFFYATFVEGPRNIKKAWQYEVEEREKPEKRGLLRYKIFAIWRAFGEEMKAMVKGVTGSIKAAGNALEELISIFFSD